MNSESVQQTRLNRYNELESHSMISWNGNSISYWNVHLFREEHDKNQGVDAYFKWNNDVFFIEVVPRREVIQDLGIHIKASSTMKYIYFMYVVEVDITRSLFEAKLVQICLIIGKSNYSGLTKRYLPINKYKKIS